MFVFHIASTTPMATSAWKRRFRSGCRSLQLLHVFLPHGNGHTRWIWRNSYELTMSPDCRTWLSQFQCLFGRQNSGLWVISASWWRLCPEERFINKTCGTRTGSKSLSISYIYMIYVYMIYVYICSKYVFYCNVMYVYMYLYIMYFNIKDMMCTIPICIYRTYIYIHIHNICKHLQISEPQQISKKTSLASTSHPQLCGFPAAGRSLDLPALKVHNKAHLLGQSFFMQKNWGWD